MPVPRWLDRLWLWAVGIAFVVIVPLKFIMWIQDYGWLRVVAIVVLLFLAGFLRGLFRASPRPTPADLPPHRP